MTDAESMGGRQDLQARLDAARRAIVEHSGYKEFLEIEALQLSLVAVFVPNLRTLLAYLDAAANNVELALELVQNVRSSSVRDRFQAETTRHLHNYLSSVHSLVDHVRRLMRGRSGPIVEQFEQRKAGLLSDSATKFVIDLRNFTHHRVLPFLGHTLSFTNVNTPEQEMESEVELAVFQLLEWDGWSASARAYLLQQGDAIRLRPVIRNHGQHVLNLNLWLLNELARANAAALGEVNRLVVEANAILTGGDLIEAERLARRMEPSLVADLVFEPESEPGEGV